MSLAHAQTVRWTLEQYYHLFEAGILPEDLRSELIEGNIVIKPKMNPPHRTSVMHANDALSRRFMDTHWVRVQLPLTLNDFSEPVPDFSVVSKTRFDETVRPPEADLLIEVAHTSLAFNRDEKASLYARDGILEYWIINIVDQVLEVYRTPQPDANAIFGAAWKSVITVPRTGTVCALFAPDVVVSVEELF